MPDRHPTPRAVAAPRSTQLMLPLLEERTGPGSPGSPGRSGRSSSSSRSNRLASACQPGRVTELLAIASREAQVLQEITACLAELSETQAAKRELGTLTAAEIREAVESRQILGAGPAASVPVGVSVGLAAVRGVSA